MDDESPNDADERESPGNFQYPLSAVGQALAKHGYAGLTTKKIAAESTRTEAALYRHYDSKDALVEAYLDAATEWFTWELDQIETTDPRERLYGICAVLMGDRIDWEHYVGLYAAIQELRGLAPRNEAFGKPLREYHEYVIAALAETIRDGIDRGVFHDVDPDSTAGMIAALCDTVPRYAHVLGLRTEAELVRERLFEFISTEVLKNDANR